MGTPPIGTPASYCGVRFRSKVEATWARFAHQLSWTWLYEPREYPGYLPDFWVNDAVWLEVKGDRISKLHEHLPKCLTALRAGGYTGQFLLVGDRPNSRVEWNGHQTGSRLGPGLVASFELDLVDRAAWVYCPDCLELESRDGSGEPYRYVTWAQEHGHLWQAPDGRWVEVRYHHWDLVLGVSPLEHRWVSWFDTSRCQRHGGCTRLEPVREGSKVHAALKGTWERARAATEETVRGVTERAWSERCRPLVIFPTEQ